MTRTDPGLRLPPDLSAGSHHVSGTIRIYRSAGLIGNGEAAVSKLPRSGKRIVNVDERRTSGILADNGRAAVAACGHHHRTPARQSHRPAHAQGRSIAVCSNLERARVVDGPEQLGVCTLFRSSMKVVALINVPSREAVQDDSVTSNHTHERAGSTRGAQQSTLNVRTVG